MPSQTFGDVWRSVALYVPDAPVSLVQEWVQDAYNQLVGRRHWAWLRRETFLTTLAARAITITTVANTNLITAPNADLVTDDEGRQIRWPGTLGTGGPIYSIDTVIDPSTAVLDQATPEAGSGISATISDIYLPMPEDFRSFESIVCQADQRPVVWWISREKLDVYDPARTQSMSTFRVLASYQLSQLAVYAGQVLYEAWPHPSAASTYIIKYFARTDSLDDDTPFTGVLATWTDAIKQGALAAAAMWPGSVAARNPYFNLPLADRLSRSFNELVKSLDVMDDDQYLMDLAQVDLSKFVGLDGSTEFLRASDATLSDYSYGGSYP